jgi:hypothetical protein
MCSQRSGCVNADDSHNITTGLENADYCWDPRLHRPQPEAPTCPVPSKGPLTREKPPSTPDSRACSGGYKAPVNLKATEAHLIGGSLPERAWMRIVQLTDGEQLSYECQVAACRRKAFGSLPAIKQHLKDKSVVHSPSCLRRLTMWHNQTCRQGSLR